MNEVEFNVPPNTIWVISEAGQFLTKHYKSVTQKALKVKMQKQAQKQESVDSKIFTHLNVHEIPQNKCLESRSEQYNLAVVQERSAQVRFRHLT